MARLCPDARLIAAVRRELNAVKQWDEVLGLARNTDFVAVISNTTEAGELSMIPAASWDDAPPASFPAKVTCMLVERFNTCGGVEAPWVPFSALRIDRP